MAYAQSQAMQRQFRLPLVPGMSCGEEMLRRNYHRRQILGVDDACGTHFPDLPPTVSSNGGGGDGDDNTDKTSSDAARAQTCAATATAALSSQGAPADLTGRVLRFYAYTIERVAESALETERVRKMVLYYYLEDDTMSLSEVVDDNAGFAMRSSLKRHLVAAPDGTPITFAQLRVGAALTFYGRTYLLYDADGFTRDFYAALGDAQPAAQTLPVDRYTASRARPPGKAHDVESIAACSPLHNLLTRAQVRATQRFLAHDREVLRCDCTWDDTASLHGSVHYLTLYYFVSDGSIALVEKDSPNSGRDAFPTFVRRQRIAKAAATRARDDDEDGGSGGEHDGNGDDAHVTRGAGGYSKEAYYSDRDIRIGNVLHLFGRAITIHDYDAFTREYLRRTYGVTAHTPLPGATPPPFVPPGAARHGLSATELQARHHQRHDEVRRRRYESAVVKFLMRLDHASYEDAIRRFVLAVYPADHTVAIYEPVIRNSGIVGGKFLQRQKVAKPSSSSSQTAKGSASNVVNNNNDSSNGATTATTANNNTATTTAIAAASTNVEYFTASDFYVGAHVTINAFPFVIMASDEHSLRYMEHNAEEFARSDINAIVRKLQAMLRSRQTGLAAALQRADEDNRTGLQMPVLLAIMAQCALDVSEQEICTVLRFFDQNKESYVSYAEVAARILPEGAALASDDRPWQAIYEESLRQETASFVSDPKEAEEKQRQQHATAAAARGARELLALYEQRRQLFVKELRAMSDYARDSCLGVDEFVRCVRQRLHIRSIADDELDALCGKLFAPPHTRVALEELLRLFNGTSTLPHTLAQIANKTAR